MDDKNEKQSSDSSRRHFLKLGAIASGALAALNSVPFVSKAAEPEAGEKVKVLTPEGKLVEVDKKDIRPVTDSDSDVVKENKRKAREGMPGHKWVMVIDLARCKHALKCQSACNKHHHVPGDRQWINVLHMQDAEDTAPYWMPKPCYHCDRPPCVAVCPVDATFKRQDGIVLVDNERCIGCRFCMAACPYSVRVFNWGEPNDPEHVKNQPYNPETSLPRKKGTVEKCDFCPDMLRNGELPHCVTACPNGVFFFGDKNEDTVTNGSETYRLSQMMKEKAGYRYMEDLGTEPNVYYLPPVNRLVPFDEADKHLDMKEEEETDDHHHKH
jgi:molybdopterin-containing oxidoreductase family iron-sulfur binding subunit